MIDNNNYSGSSDNSYSQALFELSKENNILNEVEEQASALINLISKSEDFNLLIKNPTNQQEDQVKVINLISESSGHSGIAGGQYLYLSY